MASAHERTIFDGSFPKYYDTTVSIFSLFRAKELRGEAIRMLNIKPGANALDIACGTGDFTLLIAEEVGNKGNVLGIDLSGKMINIAINKSKKYPQITYKINDFTDIPYKNFFDVAVIGFAAHEVTDTNRQKMYQQAFKSLKKGGRFLVFDFITPKNIVLKYLFILFTKIVEPHGLNYLQENHKKVLEKQGFKRVGHKIRMFAETAIYEKP